MKFLSHGTGHEISGNSLPPRIKKLAGCDVSVTFWWVVVGCHLTRGGGAVDLAALIKPRQGGQE